MKRGTVLTKKTDMVIKMGKMRSNFYVNGAPVGIFEVYYCEEGKPDNTYKRTYTADHKTMEGIFRLIDDNNGTLDKEAIESYIHLYSYVNVF